MIRCCGNIFALVGSTGVGKSTAFSILMHKAIASRPNLRALIIDPHNEFARAFAADSVVLDLRTLTFPFYLFSSRKSPMLSSAAAGTGR